MRRRRARPGSCRRERRERRAARGPASPRAARSQPIQACRRAAEIDDNKKAAARASRRNARRARASRWEVQASRPRFRGQQPTASGNKDRQRRQQATEIDQPRAGGEPLCRHTQHGNAEQRRHTPECYGNRHRPLPRRRSTCQEGQSKHECLTHHISGSRLEANAATARMTDCPFSDQLDTGCIQGGHELGQ